MCFVEFRTGPCFPVGVPGGTLPGAFRDPAGGVAGRVSIQGLRDPANVRHIMAAAWSDMITFQCAAALVGVEGPLELEAETISSGEALNEFALYSMTVRISPNKFGIHRKQSKD